MENIKLTERNGAGTKINNTRRYYMCVKLNLNLNIGNGYLDGNAATDFNSWKINIQQGWPDISLIVPSDLKLNAGKALISFDTEMGNQILLKANVKSEDTDMIRLFTDIDTLKDLTKKLPVVMNIQKDSDIH